MPNPQTFHVEHYSRKTLLGLGPAEHRWRAVHSRNGEILASGEGYTHYSGLRATCYQLFGPVVRIVLVTK